MVYLVYRIQRVPKPPVQVNDLRQCFLLIPFQVTKVQQSTNRISDYYLKNRVEVHTVDEPFSPADRAGNG